MTILYSHCTTCQQRRNFCDLQPQSLATLDGIKFTAMYPRGAQLFAEGEMPRGVFVLCAGKVKLTTSSTEGRTLIVRIAGPGELLGSSAVLLSKACEISAETISRSFGLAQTTSEKLARLMMDWCDERGEQTDKGIRLKVLLTHEEIAQMLGTTRETVTRLPTSLRSKKVIEIKGSTVNVMQYEALEAMVTV